MRSESSSSSDLPLTQRSALSTSTDAFLSRRGGFDVLAAVSRSPPGEPKDLRGYSDLRGYDARRWCPDGRSLSNTPARPLSTDPLGRPGRPRGANIICSVGAQLRYDSLHPSGEEPRALRGTLMSSISIDLLEKLPKTDLHVHLDGSLRLDTLIELAREYGVELPSYTDGGAARAGLQGASTTACASTCRASTTPAPCCRARRRWSAWPTSWPRTTRPRACATSRCASRRSSTSTTTSRIEHVLRAVDRGLDRAKREFNRAPAVVERRGAALRVRHHRLRPALLRRRALASTSTSSCRSTATPPPKRVFALASLELAQAAVRIATETGLPIVGFDLAGAEAGYPAEDHVRGLPATPTGTS